MRLEMWDSAAEMGPSMNPGDLFLIRNARMVTNHYSGYIQAKLQQNKIVHLKETDADTNPHLKTLMELASSSIFLSVDTKKFENRRKKRWEENQSNPPDNENEHRLIENFEEDKFLSCTVEVRDHDGLRHSANSRQILQAVTDTKEGSFIYVTDYTSHLLLESLKIDEPWAHGLTASIVKIFLVDAQKKMTESVVPGSFYSIRKLRWKYSHVDGCIRAQLGGAEKLITMLNPNKTDNERLNGLLRQVRYLFSPYIRIDKTLDARRLGKRPLEAKFVSRRVRTRYPELTTQRRKNAIQHVFESKTFHRLTQVLCS
jgi:hypothetical protein